MMADVISEQDFQSEATRFLEENASPRVEISSGWGEGSDEVAILPEKDPRPGARGARSGQGVGADQVRRRLRLDHRSDRARRQGPASQLPADLRRGRGQIRDTAR